MDVFDFAAQADVARDERPQVSDVDQPSGSVGGVEKFHRTPLGSSSASSAWVSSTSLFTFSKR